MTVKIIGILFLAQIVTYMIGNQFLISPVIYSSDFLASASENTNKLLVGSLLEIICGIAVVTISVLLFPILKKHSERIAIWYVGLQDQ